ncbi:hypothetical protein [Cupriavidus pinatubonensis]|uniref:hypothetical protein n=1 Tax=Cupriavidus pinatubonensis TaxID=248026 RepID=UPI003613D997
MELHMHSHHFVRRMPYWRAAAMAGVTAGVIFVVLEVLLSLAMGGSAWAPLRMTAAIVMGHGVATQVTAFSAGIVLVGLAVHFALSVAFGVILAAIMAPFNLDSSVSMTSLVGAVFGLAVYLIDFYGMTRLFPWFMEARGALSLVTHLVFGLVAADVYLQLEKRAVGAGSKGR